MAHGAYDREDGFTLVELIVVILIISALAAIALPVFLGQRAKAQDASAKSDARTLAGQVEACHTTTERYDTCESGDGALDDDGVPASVTAVAVAGGYDVTATSQSGNTFVIARRNGNLTRSCSDVGTSKGGCEGTSW
jgi:type IV pilus assembly protein PilA